MIEETTPTDILVKELEELREKWDANMKTKDKAGGNSNDNQRAIIIRSILRERNES